MKKLEKLTKKQEDYIPILRKEWEDVFYKNEAGNITGIKAGQSKSRGHA